MFKKSGFIYICAFDNGLVKVGKSLSNPESRIRSHKSSMSIVGASLNNSWISEPHQKFGENEKILIDYISKFCVSESREWANIDFDCVLSKAKELDFVSTVETVTKNIDFDRFENSGIFDIYDKKWIRSSSYAYAVSLFVQKISCHEMVHHQTDSGLSQFELIFGIMTYLDLLCVEEFIDRIIYVLDETDLLDEIIDDLLVEGQIEIAKRYDK